MMGEQVILLVIQFLFHCDDVIKCHWSTIAGTLNLI